MAHKTQQHWDKPIDLISPALASSFAQTAASDLVNSEHVHSHAHWYLCVEGIKPVTLQRNYVQKLHLHQTFQLLVALKLVFTKCHKTPGPDSPPTDGYKATVGRESSLLCWGAQRDQNWGLPRFPCSSWKPCRRLFPGPLGASQDLTAWPACRGTVRSHACPCGISWQGCAVPCSTV